MELASFEQVSPILLRANHSCQGQPLPIPITCLEIHPLHPTAMVAITIQPGRILSRHSVNWKEEQPSYLPLAWLRSRLFLALCFVLAMSWSCHLMAITPRGCLQKDTLLGWVSRFVWLQQRAMRRLNN